VDDVLELGAAQALADAEAYLNSWGATERCPDCHLELCGDDYGTCPRCGTETNSPLK
jgi:hypothetical protein